MRSFKGLTNRLWQLNGGKYGFGKYRQRTGEEASRRTSSLGLGNVKSLQDPYQPFLILFGLMLPQV